MDVADDQWFRLQIIEVNIIEVEKTGKISILPTV
jgi:hypothetical protein